MSIILQITDKKVLDECKIFYKLNVVFNSK